MHRQFCDVVTLMHGYNQPFEGNAGVARSKNESPVMLGSDSFPGGVFNQKYFVFLVFLVH